MEWMLLPLKRYADFSGRSRRMEYWMFILGSWLLYVVGAVLIFVVGDLSGALVSESAGISIAMIVAFGLVFLGLFIPRWPCKSGAFTTRTGVGGWSCWGSSPMWAA
jgi:uncharacterized membrane protein YhaH (DUF805 family)